MTFFDKFPRSIFKERRIVYSQLEIIEKFKVGLSIGKVPLVSLYSYQVVKDNKGLNPIIDCLLFSGNKQDLINSIQEFRLRGYKIYWYYDGKDYYLIIKTPILSESDLLKFKEYYKTKYNIDLNMDLNKMIIFPGLTNPKYNKKTKMERII